MSEPIRIGQSAEEAVAAWDEAAAKEEAVSDTPREAAMTLVRLREARENLRTSYHPPSDAESTLFSWLCAAITFAEETEQRLSEMTKERDELLKQCHIRDLAVPLEEDLAAKIDEALKHLAMNDGWTPDGVARLLVECQKRMAADWLEVGQLRREVQQLEAALQCYSDEQQKDRARIQQLEADLIEARGIVANVNNSVFGSQGYFTKPSCVEAVEDIKAESNRLRKENAALREQVRQHNVQCAHGHTSRVVGCVSCVLVFNRDQRQQQEPKP